MENVRDMFNAENNEMQKVSQVKEMLKETILHQINELLSGRLFKRLYDQHCCGGP